MKLRTMPTLAEVEQKHIENVVRRVGGNMSEAANILGIDRRTLYRKMEHYRRTKQADPGVVPGPVKSNEPLFEVHAARCPHCNVINDPPELHFRLVCPGCERIGCPQCMPAGRGCDCPECEGA
jgi:hypothetical protein